MQNKKFISFTYTDKEKFIKASRELKVNNYVEVHTNRGIQYGKITKIGAEKISIELNKTTRHYLWSSIDSLTLVFKGDE